MESYFKHKLPNRFGVTLLIALVGGCATVEKDLLVSKSIVDRTDWIPYEEIGERQNQLMNIRVNLPRNVPLKLLPMLRHLNRRLAEEGLRYRVGVYFLPTRPDWYFSDSLLETGAFSPFEGQTETEIREEINRGSLMAFLDKLRIAYSELNMLFRTDWIILTPTIGIHYHPGYDQEIRERVRIRKERSQ